MSVSIVMSTYNGRCYVAEQIASLCVQTRLPDELRVVDDASTDETVSVVRRCLDDAGFSRVHFSVNKHNRGWQRNFYDLIVSSNADFIFPCDQDDIWHPRKLEYMLQVMAAHPEIDVLACSVEPFYENGAQRTAADTTESSGNVLDAVKICDFNEKSLYVSRPGCTYCVRRSFVEEVKPYWNSEWPHDAFLWRMAGAKGTLATLDKKLVRFRRHGDNASSRKEIDVASRLSDVEYYLDMVDALKHYADELPGIPQVTRALLVDMDEWFSARKSFLGGDGRISCLLAMIRRHKFYATKKGFVVDFAVGTLHLRL